MPYVDGYVLPVPKKNLRVMKDPRLAAMMGPGGMPFDVKRMHYGGFKVLVSA